MSGPLLWCRRLEKRFGKTEALRGVDVEIGRGEIVAITGPSGSGKSTLLQCLAGILTPDSGELGFKSTRIDLLDSSERALLRRRSFGFMFQFGELITELTAQENIALPLLLEGRRRREAMSEAAVWLDRLGLNHLKGSTPGEMSGGERQRVAAARALAHQPEVVFADEPTGALDSLAAETLLELLVGLVEDSGMTLVLVTHDARVAAYGQREIVVRDGRTSTTANNPVAGA